MNSKGESLKSLAESLGLSDVITYLETFSADSASEDTYNAHSQQKSVFILALE